MTKNIPNISDCFILKSIIENAIKHHDATEETAALLFVRPKPPSWKRWIVDLFNIPYDSLIFIGRYEDGHFIIKQVQGTKEEMEKGVCRGCAVKKTLSAKENEEII